MIYWPVWGLFYGLMVALLGSCHSQAETHLENNRVVLFGKNQYSEYRSGTLPIIITVPHGGYLKPNAMPDRQCTDCIYAMDANTQELARSLDSLLKIRTGRSPHLIISKLHRIKLDPNRDVADAADGNAAAAAAWSEYHQWIEDAKKSLLKQHSAGLLIDLHGHSHAIQRLELGYLLESSDLRQTPEILNAQSNKKEFSLKNLFLKNKDKTTLDNLLRGAHSFGTLTHQQGYPAVPSQQIPAPKIGEDYFSGGYTILRHGSSAGGRIDAIQVECNRQNLRDTPANRHKFAAALAQTIAQFYEHHYGAW